MFSDQLTLGGGPPGPSSVVLVSSCGGFPSGCRGGGRSGSGRWRGSRSGGWCSSGRWWARLGVERADRCRAHVTRSCGHGVVIHFQVVVPPHGQAERLLAGSAGSGGISCGNCGVVTTNAGNRPPELVLWGQVEVGPICDTCPPGCPSWRVRWYSRPIWGR